MAMLLLKQLAVHPPRSSLPHIPSMPHSLCASGHLQDEYITAHSSALPATHGNPASRGKAEAFGDVPDFFKQNEQLDTESPSGQERMGIF